MERLAGIGFQVDELEIRFSCVKRSIGAAHMKRLRVDVLPILRYVSRQKAKPEAQATG